MSRVAKNPVVLPKGVEVALNGQEITVKGSKGSLSAKINALVQVEMVDAELRISGMTPTRNARTLAGTTRSQISNMVTGVSIGFEMRLTMVGVGYRGQAKGNGVTLSLGYSHPIEFVPPPGVTVEAPSQTEILVKGCDKQKVGQVAANIRSYRPPEPYKGKGIRYSNEVIATKEAKKK